MQVWAISFAQSTGKSFLSLVRRNSRAGCKAFTASLQRKNSEINGPYRNDARRENRGEMISGTKTGSPGALKEAPEDFARKTPNPGLLGGIASDLIRLTLYPLLLKRWHPSANSILGEIRKYEFATPETVDGAQWSRLLAIAGHAAQHVPYYRKLFREHGIRFEGIRTPADFARIPVLTKAALQANLDDLASENRERVTWQPNASGGSTGKPVQFFQDPDYWER